MLQMRVRKALFGFAVAGAAALGAAGPAHAIQISGSWDPTFGSSFTGLGWNGTANWFIPDACLPGSGTINNSASCSVLGGGMYMINATVNFYALSDSTMATKATLTFAPNQYIVQSVVAAGFNLSGVTSTYTTAGVLSGNAAFINSLDLDEFAWGLTFVGGQARLAFAEWENSESKQECPFGQTKSDDCGINDGVNFPANIAFSTPVPEPQTFALMLAGLGSMGFLLRRRRREQNCA